MPVAWLEADTPFPPVEQALDDPDGLLAASADIDPERLVAAYRQGIFPWYEEGQPVMWWSPDPRMVLYPERLRISRSLGKLLRRHDYRISFDTDFGAVMRACARPEHRPGSSGTWITNAMIEAYTHLHQQGIAHSVEVWSQERLVGGLYGVAMGRVFFGESMFSAEANTSKLALVELVNMLRHWGYRLIDCQVQSEHLVSLGAENISRARFCQEVVQAIASEPAAHAWQPDTGVDLRQ